MKSKSKFGKLRSSTGGNEGDLGDIDEVETGTMLSALKFGWNACFSANSDNEVSDAGERWMSNDELEWILDRNRGVIPMENTGKSLQLSSSSSLSSSANVSNESKQDVSPIMSSSSILVKSSSSPIIESTSPLNKVRRTSPRSTTAVKVEVNKAGGSPIVKHSSTTFLHLSSPTHTSNDKKHCISVITDTTTETSSKRLRTSDNNNLKESQECTVADFEETVPLVDLRQFNGVRIDKLKVKSFGDISSEWVIHQARQRKSRMTTEHVVGVGIVNILKINSYSLEEGEPSVFEREMRGKRDQPISGNYNEYLASVNKEGRVSK